MGPEQIAPFFDYGAKAGTAISFIFIMILLWEAFRIYKLFVEKHFEHVTKLEQIIAENEKNNDTAIQALTQTIATLNSTILLNNQSILQALSEFKNMNAAMAKIEQATSRCGLKE